VSAVELTRIERATLASQLRIRRALEVTTNLDGLIEALENGYEEEYSSLFHEIGILNDGEILSVEGCRFVSAILSVYGALHFFAQGVAGITSGDAEAAREGWGRFPGFVAHGEAPQLRYARYLLLVKRRFWEQLLHWPGEGAFITPDSSMGAYERMTGVWSRLDPEHQRQLTREDALALRAALGGLESCAGNLSGG
jgi:uncharacterized protein YfbU (UPF0304 family)